MIKLVVTNSKLQSISITPATLSIPIGNTAQFIATGIYSDGSTQNLTNNVTWISSSITTATISNAIGSHGLATGLVAGSSGITASLDGVTASTNLVVRRDFAYVASNNNNQIFKCSTNPTTSELFDCTSTGSTFHSPTGIAINNGFAYIANSGYVYIDNSGYLAQFENMHTISKCSIDENGELLDCSRLSSNPDITYGIATNNGFIYFTGEDYKIHKCAINPENGVLISNNCAIVSGDFYFPGTVYFSNGIAYVPNQGYNDVSICQVNSSNGNFSNCVRQKSSAFKSPVSLSIYNGMAYVSNNNTKLIPDYLHYIINYVSASGCHCPTGGRCIGRLGSACDV
jgi:hypothetical protein